MRPKGSPEALEVRRRLAVNMLLNGQEVSEVAEAVGAAALSVRRWWADYRDQGEAALAAGTVPGRPPKLTPRQAQQVLAWVREGNAEDFGFDTPRWTAPRVAALIQQRLGIRFHPRYLNDWLGRHGISPQLPQRVPREQDPAAIQHWIDHDWPRIKRGPEPRGHSSFSPMKAGF